ncbi:MAG: Efflux ABC transporter, permease protein, partial [uncultured bacterium]
VSDKLRREYEESFKMVEGTFEDLNSEKVENPAILSTDKAQDLNVKMNDIIRVRFKNIFGQDQAARITVVGIMKITNIFMSGVIFVELLNAKSMMGYSEFEMGSLNLTLKNPVKNAVKVADRIHSLLKPDIAVIVSQLSYKEKKEQASILCFQNDENAKKIITENTIVVESQEKDFMAKKGVLITNTLAKRMELHSGDKINISYENKFRNKMTQNEYVITGIFEPKNCLAENVLLLNENIFYDTYYDNLPKKASAYPEAYIPAENDPVYKALGTEWILLPRTKTTDEFEKKLHELTGKKGKATFLDVATMYEIASAMLNLEKALNIITLCAVFVLFFIILIGVVNTLRMTIRERTREIGTMRAIGMQKNEVRNIFIFETFFLTFFSSLTGIIFAFLVMRGISGIKINMSDNPLGMFLIDEHLFFLPTFSGIFLNVGFIILIAVLTAYFPARKAANLKAAEAFRHYE